PSGTYPGPLGEYPAIKDAINILMWAEWKCPQLAVLLTLGVRRRTAGREPFLYRDDLLEFDRGDLSRCTDGRKLVRRTGEVWWVQFARVRRLEWTARLKVMSFMHSPDFSGSSQSHFMSISYFFRGLVCDDRSIA